MDRSQYELVDALDRTGSMTAAAVELRTAQPSVTRRLAVLERQIGARLFDRGRGGAVPTPTGRVVVAAARDALDALERADRTVARAAAGQLGILRIGVTPTLGADVLPAIISRLRSEHDDVQLELVASGDSERLRAGVLDASLDVALAVAPRRAEAGLHIALRAPQEFALVVPSGDALDTGAPILRSALLGRPMVALRHGEGLRVVLDALFADLGAEADVAIETTEREMLLPLVAAGLGASLVPLDFARSRSAAGVAVVPLDPPVIRPVAVVHRAGTTDPHVQSFIACARHVLGG